MNGFNRPSIAFGSPEWGKVEEWLGEELLSTYQRLSGLEVSERETQQLRGRIALLVQMLEFRNLAAPSGR
jgi:hypothetical protein